MNIVTAWKQRTLAEKSVKSAPEMAVIPTQDREANREYQILLQQLGEHLLKLDSLAGVDERTAYKAEIMPEFETHVMAIFDAVNETGKAVQDDIYGYYMIWAFDVGNFELGLKLAETALKFGINLPPRFRSSLADFVIENVAQAAEATIILEKPFPKEFLQKTIEITATIKAADQKRAKIHRWLGILYFKDAKAQKDAKQDDTANAEMAFQHLEVAYHYDRKFGALSELKSLAKRFNKKVILDDDDTKDAATKDGNETPTPNLKDNPANPPA